MGAEPGFPFLSGIDVVAHWSLPTLDSEGRRFGVYDGKRRMRVSPENFAWMKTATPEQLGAMRAVTIPDEPPTWLGRAPNTGGTR